MKPVFTFLFAEYVITNLVCQTISPSQRLFALSEFRSKTGDFNAASLYQTGYGMKGDFQQRGNNNFSSSTQTGAFYEETLLQTGNNNRAVVSQTGSGTGAASGGSNLVGITQSGNNMVANVSQTGGGGNVATIFQH